MRIHLRSSWSVCISKSIYLHSTLTHTILYICLIYSISEVSHGQIDQLCAIRMYFNLPGDWGKTLWHAEVPPGKLFRLTAEKPYADVFMWIRCQASTLAKIGNGWCAELLSFSYVGLVELTSQSSTSDWQSYSWTIPILRTTPTQPCKKHMLYVSLGVCLRLATSTYKSPERYPFSHKTSLPLKSWLRGGSVFIIVTYI